MSENSPNFDQPLALPPGTTGAEQSSGEQGQMYPPRDPEALAQPQDVDWWVDPADAAPAAEIPADRSEAGGPIVEAELVSDADFAEAQRRNDRRQSAYAEEDAAQQRTARAQKAIIDAFLKAQAGAATASHRGTSAASGLASPTPGSEPLPPSPAAESFAKTWADSIRRPEGRRELAVVDDTPPAAETSPAADSGGESGDDDGAPHAEAATTEETRRRAELQERLDDVREIIRKDYERQLIARYRPNGNAELRGKIRAEAQKEAQSLGSAEVIGYAASMFDVDLSVNVPNEGLIRTARGLWQALEDNKQVVAGEHGDESKYVDPDGRSIDRNVVDFLEQETNYDRWILSDAELAGFNDLIRQRELPSTIPYRKSDGSTGTAHNPQLLELQKRFEASGRSVVTATEGQILTDAQLNAHARIRLSEQIANLRSQQSGDSGEIAAALPEARQQAMSEFAARFPALMNDASMIHTLTDRIETRARELAATNARNERDSVARPDQQRPLGTINAAAIAGELSNGGHMALLTQIFEQALQTTEVGAIKVVTHRRLIRKSSTGTLGGQVQTRGVAPRQTLLQLWQAYEASRSRR